MLNQNELIKKVKNYNKFSNAEILAKAYDFAVNRIKPVNDQLKSLNKDLSLKLFKEAGELGFLSVDVPEKFGGLELDKTTSSIIVDCLSSGESASMMVTISAHTGIATLPIIWYGT